MPRILPIDSRVPTLHGVLIKRQAVNEQIRAYATVQEARAHARRIVKAAQIKASSLKNSAMREGFQAGWLDSLNAVYNALSDSNQLHQQIDQSLKQAVRRALESSLAQPGLELQLLEGWFLAGPRLDDELHLVLPRKAQDQIETLKRSIERVTGIAPVVSVGESENVVIQSGDQIYEFCPERTLEEMNALVNSCFQRLEVKKQCQRWSARIVRAWLDEIDQRFSAESQIEENAQNEQDESGEEENFDDEFDDFDANPNLNYLRN